MDKNSAIGLVLIALLLLLYFNYLSPKPSETTPNEQSINRTSQQPSSQLERPHTPSIDSIAVADYGPLSQFVEGNASMVTVENEVMEISFSSKGAIPRTIQLKAYVDYHHKKLYLLNETSSQFELKATYNGRTVDLYQLYYTSSQQQKGDSTQLTFSATLAEGRYIKHVYTIPNQGYTFSYTFSYKGVNISSKNLTYRWVNKMPSLEKDVSESRNKTAVNYYTQTDGFDGISNMTGGESKIIVDSLYWISFKHKFFVSALIANHAFSGGSLSSYINEADTSTVRQGEVTILFPNKDIGKGEVRCQYFFGPTAYTILSAVTQDFEKNVELGWPPILWVNEFLIIPIFKFLERFISNYGIIIMIMVIIVKIILSPLSYKSYLGMAKMKLLKPEQDLLKEKYGSDMAKIQQEQLKLYQQAGVNPLSGCVPILLQMPILFAMFYFFPVSIELRQASFLWAEDLSTYDSIIDLPFHVPFYGSHISLFVLLMTASTLIYTWQNNQISSAQGPMKSISYVMPVIFMFVLNSFSAGLSFYYFVSNLVTFAQQAIIRRFVNEEKIKNIMNEHKQKVKTEGSKQSRFMNKLQGAMKASEQARKKKT